MIIDLCDDDDLCTEPFSSTSSSNLENIRDKSNTLKDNDSAAIMKSKKNKTYSAEITEYSDSDDFQSTQSSLLPTERKTAKSKKSTQEERKAAKEAQIQMKLAEKQKFNQERGYFKHQEISLIMESNLSTSELGMKIHEEFNDNTSSDHQYNIHTGTSSIPGLCRWTHRPFTLGGRGNVSDPSVQILPFVVILYPTVTFISKIHESLSAIANNTNVSSHSMEFDALNVDIERIITQLSQEEGCPSKSKIVLLLVDIDKTILELQKEMPVMNSIDDVTAYLICEKGLDVMKLKKAEVGDYLMSVTRALADTPYRTESGAFDFSNKLTLEQTWLNMLQMMPKVSLKKASAIASQFPTPQSLCDALQNCSVPEQQRMTLLSDKIETGKKNPKLANVGICFPFNTYNHSISTALYILQLDDFKRLKRIFSITKMNQEKLTTTVENGNNIFGRYKVAIEITKFDLLTI
eukprot:gene3556-7074_t